jgi:hypothetical protein
MRWGCPRKYPQGGQAVYVVFHVKLRNLWITSVDNFAVVWLPQTVMWIYILPGPSVLKASFLHSPEIDPGQCR